MKIIDKHFSKFSYFTCVILKACLLLIKEKEINKWWPPRGTCSYLYNVWYMPITSLSVQTYFF